METDIADKKRIEIICSLMNCSGYSRVQAEIAAARQLGELTDYVKMIENAGNTYIQP